MLKDILFLDFNFNKLGQTYMKQNKQKKATTFKDTLNNTKQAHNIDHFDYRVARLRLFFNIAADQYGGELGEHRRVNDAFSV